MSAILPVANEMGKKIIWATKTGTETDRPIEELKIIDKYLMSKNQNSKILVSL